MTVTNAGLCALPTDTTIAVTTPVSQSGIVTTRPHSTPQHWIRDAI